MVEGVGGRHLQTTEARAGAKPVVARFHFAMPSAPAW